MECYLGTVTAFAFNFTPMYFAACNGQQMQIQQNSALYALLGIAFGGNGTTNFNLPNLQGRTPVHSGPTHAFASAFGQETATLTAANLPAHNHPLNETQPNQTVTAATTVAVNASSSQGNINIPGNTAYWAKSFDTLDGTVVSSYNATKNATLASDAVQVTVTPTFNKANLTIGNTGNGAAFSLTQPSLTLNFCICTSGLFPSRT